MTLHHSHPPWLPSLSFALLMAKKSVASSLTADYICIYLRTAYKIVVNKNNLNVKYILCRLTFQAPFSLPIYYNKCSSISEALPSSISTHGFIHEKNPTNPPRMGPGAFLNKDSCLYRAGLVSSLCSVALHRLCLEYKYCHFGLEPSVYYLST